MDKFIGSFSFIGTNLNVPESEILMMLFLPALLTFLLFKIYLISSPKKTTIMKDIKGIFFISVILSSSVAIVMMLVGDNLSRAFALLGLFSIIRFRNSGKSMIPLLFILISIVIGIITGLTFFLLAIQFSLFVGFIIILTNLLDPVALQEENKKTDKKINNDKQSIKS